MVTKFNCPGCGAENSFKSALSLYAVCPFCRASVFRGEGEVELIGKVSDLAGDNSPLQLGSSGQFNGQSFTIVGRVRKKWKDGFWNEWNLMLANGQSAWLAEAQGEFYFLTDADKSFSRSLAEKWFLKDTLSIGDERFVIIDIKESEVLMAEGELPYRAHVGDQFESADFRQIAGARFGSLEKSAKGDDRRAYVGSVVRLSDLKLSSVRKFDGW